MKVFLAVGTGQSIVFLDKGLGSFLFELYGYCQYLYYSELYTVINKIHPKTFALSPVLQQAKSPSPD